MQGQRLQRLWQKKTCAGSIASNMPVSNTSQLKVLGGGGVGEETLLQKGPSPTKYFKALFQPPQSISKRYSTPHKPNATSGPGCAG
ncbi:conserved protein of unknown function [Desulfovibrio sp. 86]|nr:conserved protein of unknown function [Desulfovibrio sp. 86]